MWQYVSEYPKKRKYKYKINRRTATRWIYHNLMDVLFKSIPSLSRVLNALKSDIIKHLSSVRIALFLAILIRPDILLAIQDPF